MRSNVSDSLDLRGVPCPVNSARILMALAILDSGERLEAMVDEGEPIENVPPAIEAAGYKVVSQESRKDHWLLLIEV
jgi:TusA-related sulfurtransferase